MKDSNNEHLGCATHSAYWIVAFFLLFFLFQIHTTPQPSPIWITWVNKHSDADWAQQLASFDYHFNLGMHRIFSEGDSWTLTVKAMGNQFHLLPNSSSRGLQCIYFCFRYALKKPLFTVLIFTALRTALRINAWAVCSVSFSWGPHHHGYYHFCPWRQMGRKFPVSLCLTVSLGFFINCQENRK